MKCMKLLAKIIVVCTIISGQSLFAMDNSASKRQQENPGFFRLVKSWFSQAQSTQPTSSTQPSRPASQDDLHTAYNRLSVLDPKNAAQESLALIKLLPATNNRVEFANHVRTILADNLSNQEIQYTALVQQLINDRDQALGSSPFAFNDSSLKQLLSFVAEKIERTERWQQRINSLGDQNFFPKEQLTLLQNALQQNLNMQLKWFIGIIAPFIQVAFKQITALNISSSLSPAHNSLQLLNQAISTFKTKQYQAIVDRYASSRNANEAFQEGYKTLQQQAEQLFAQLSIYAKQLQNSLTNQADAYKNKKYANPNETQKNAVRALASRIDAAISFITTAQQTKSELFKLFSSQALGESTNLKLVKANLNDAQKLLAPLIQNSQSPTSGYTGMRYVDDSVDYVKQQWNSWKQFFAKYVPAQQAAQQNQKRAIVSDTSAGNTLVADRVIALAEASTAQIERSNYMLRSLRKNINNNQLALLQKISSQVKETPPSPVMEETPPSPVKALKSTLKELRDKNTLKALTDLPLQSATRQMLKKQLEVLNAQSLNYAQLIINDIKRIFAQYQNKEALKTNRDANEILSIIKTQAELDPQRVTNNFAFLITVLIDINRYSQQLFPEEQTPAIRLFEIMLEELESIKKKESASGLYIKSLTN